MNKDLANSLQASLRISVEQIVREEYEMLILKKLFESEMGISFVFKGGTALRLAYGSPRFSEDLDFSAVNKFNKISIDKLMASIAKEYQNLKLIETRQKYFTYFALFKVKEEFLKQTFSIKFEASIRPEKLRKDKDYKLIVLNSKVTNLTVLSQVAALEWIKKEKLTIKPPRIRDVFDLWFINQKLGKPTPLDFNGLGYRIVKRELNKFLPDQDRKLLLPWLTKK